MIDVLIWIWNRGGLEGDKGQRFSWISWAGGYGCGRWKGAGWDFNDVQSFANVHSLFRGSRFLAGGKGLPVVGGGGGERGGTVVKGDGGMVWWVALFI